MNKNAQFRFWSIVMAVGGVAFLCGAVAFFMFSQLPHYGWLQLVCAIAFFGSAEYFRRCSQDI